MTTTDLRQPATVPVLLGVGVLAIAVGLGFGLPPLARAIQAVLEGTPFPVPGLLRVVGDLPLAWSLPILGLLGLVGGVVLAVAAIHDGLRLRVADDHLEYEQDAREGWIERDEAQALYRDGRYLVVLDPAGLVRARLDADGLRAGDLRDAFGAHGYVWHERDPYDGAYHRWVDGRPGFTPDEHALLRRWRAAKDAPEREEVEALLREAGLAVRRREGKVEVRRAAESHHGTHRRPPAS